MDEFSWHEGKRAKWYHDAVGQLVGQGAEPLLQGAVVVLHLLPVLDPLSAAGDHLSWKQITPHEKQGTAQLKPARRRERALQIPRRLRPHLYVSPAPRRERWFQSSTLYHTL